ncbi:ATP-dependent helicase [Crassaminicella profunda]|uniref:ATP-dependent helicase n=1 Tax=Crassaminicella profunda TaxID=1286698 RepID=UPI001CA77F32|nr:ATP-dependent helicase [Crassaminicella profunda]QZY54186.1 ATP-dependent helicase [Crassaminicella profunda]
MKDSFFHLLKTDHHIHLNNQQKQAVLHKDGPSLTLAVPGSGKTTSLICRTANLILNHNIHPSNILSVTFSRASAKDMKKRFFEVFGKVIRQNVYFSTIHRLALRIVSRYAKMNAFEYTIIEGEKSPIQKNVLLKRIYQQVNHSFPNEDELEALLSTISFVKNSMIHIEEFVSYDFEVEKFKEIYTHYESYKKKHHLIDFDDMLSLALKILRKNKHLLTQYRKQYPYIQVDEAQDTSKVQHEIIKLLTFPKNNLFMVADDDQSIYGFRGAYPQALLDFSKTYKEGRVFFLEKNYRSSQEIVTISNTFIKSNTERYFKNMYTDNEYYAPISMVNVQNAVDQLNYLLEEINQNTGTTAILYRNNLSSVPLIDTLERNSIPFSMQGFNMSFFNHWLVKDIFAFLDLSLNPYDITSFERIYYKMNGYISKASVSFIKEQPRSISIFDYLVDFPDLKPYQQKNLKRLKEDFYSLAHMRPQAALNFIEENLAYKKYLKSNCQRLKCSYENVLFIFTQLKIIASKTDSIINFMERFNKLQKILYSTKNKKENTSVLLSTVHSSKGLEFDHVYLIDLVDGQFPPKSKMDHLDEEEAMYLEEERRLFYVGMTRAKKSLSLVVPKFQDGAYMRPSPFVGEVKKCINKCFPAIKDTSYRNKKDTYSTSISSTTKQTNSSISHPFKINTLVKHKAFGTGLIKAIDGDIAQIDFKSLGMRGLSLRICIEQNVLSPL